MNLKTWRAQLMRIDAPDIAEIEAALLTTARTNVGPHSAAFLAMLLMRTHLEVQRLREQLVTERAVAGEVDLSTAALAVPRLKPRP